MPLSEPQAQIAGSPHRFRVAICGRRFGKTYLAQRELARFAREPNRRCWFIAPTRSQGKGIVWESMKARLQDLRWVTRINESDLTIYLRNNSEISIKSADAYDRMRGYSTDFVVFDEFADMDPAVFTAVRPTLSDRGGHALFIGTPKGTANWAKDIWDRAITAPDSWARWQFTTLEGGQITAQEVEQARRELDERTFRQEYEARFETFSGRIYYAFTDHNVQPAPEPVAAHVLVGMDFNVDPMSAVIGQRQGDVMWIRDEIRMFGSNTDEMVSELRRRYPTQRITVYPDPAARQRKTSAAGRTDLTILQAAGFEVRAPRSHDALRDGINAVNSRLESADKQRRLLIAPECKYTRESLERHCYRPGTSQPDKDSGYDHMTDALRYMITAIWPVRPDLPQQPTQRWIHQTR